MAGYLTVVALFLALACSSAQITEPTATPLDARGINQQIALQLPPGSALGVKDLTPAPVVGSQACLGVPVSGYVTWTCPPGANECSGTCIPGTKAPYGPPVAVCTAGKWVISRTCMAGKIASIAHRTHHSSGRVHNKSPASSLRGHDMCCIPYVVETGCQAGTTLDGVSAALPVQRHVEFLITDKPSDIGVHSLHQVCSLSGVCPAHILLLLQVASMALTM